MRRRARADYDWKLVQILTDGRATTVIEIVDRDLGNMSVTNDIENILLEISDDLDDDNPLSENAVIYRDSEGLWDEIVLDEVGNFRSFAALPRGRCRSELQAEAVVRLVARQLEVRG